MKIKNNLNRFRVENGLTERMKCTEEENQKLQELDLGDRPLPDDIVGRWYGTKGNTEFYKAPDISELSNEEIQEYLAHVQIKEIKKSNALLSTIKTGVVFFVVLTVISLLLSVISLFT